MISPVCGDIVIQYKKGGLYCHAAIYLGKPVEFKDFVPGYHHVIRKLNRKSDYVIHFYHENDGDPNVVMLSEFSTSFPKYNVYRMTDRRPLALKEVVRRAFAFIGTGNYSLLDNNCQHFVTYCKFGDSFLLPAQVTQNALVCGAAVSCMTGLGIPLIGSLFFFLHNGTNRGTHRETNVDQTRSIALLRWHIGVCGSPFADDELLNALDNEYTKYLTASDAMFIREFVRKPFEGKCIEDYLTSAGTSVDACPHPYFSYFDPYVTSGSYGNFENNPHRVYLFMYDLVVILIHTVRAPDLPREGYVSENGSIRQKLIAEGYLRK